MCAEKRHVTSKIDRLIEAMDRLSAALLATPAAGLPPDSVRASRITTSDSLGLSNP